MKRALVIDDEDVLRRAYGRLLRREGYETIEAASVTDAFEALLVTGPFQLVLCDFNLPDGTGAEIYAMLPDELRAVFVLHTANPHQALRYFPEGVLRLGKPPRRGELSEVLRALG